MYLIKAQHICMCCLMRFMDIYYCSHTDILFSTFRYVTVIYTIKHTVSASFKYLQILSPPCPPSLHYTLPPLTHFPPPPSIHLSTRSHPNFPELAALLIPSESPGVCAVAQLRTLSASFLLALRTSLCLYYHTQQNDPVLLT